MRPHPPISSPSARQQAEKMLRSRRIRQSPPNSMMEISLRIRASDPRCAEPAAMADGRDAPAGGEEADKCEELDGDGDKRERVRAPSGSQVREEDSAALDANAKIIRLARDGLSSE